MAADEQNPQTSGYIKGELLHTIFHNEQENFSIAKIKVLATNEEYSNKDIVIKGYFSDLQETAAYNFYGILERHAKFGLQYKVTSYETVVPDTKEGLIAYLSSDMFYGIGKKTAEKIVDVLGDNAVSKILNDSNVLSQVPGLKKEKARSLVETLKENQGFEHIAVHLSKYGIGLKMAQKIYKQYKDEAISILQEDPYQYVFDIEGFGFQTADEIARANGLSLSHPSRIGAGCIYVLQKNIQDGHVYLPVELCAVEVSRLLLHPDLQVTNEMVIERLEALNKEKSIILMDGNVYLPSLYYAEDGVASNLKRLISKPVEHEILTAELLKIIGEIEEEEVLSYGKEQFEAIQKALQSKLMILTGGPGTGKTTVVKGILNAYAEIHNISLNPADYNSSSDYPFTLTAPTGRAAKRLTESTGLPAVTIHRLLGWDGQNGFEKNEHEQLTGKYLIVDEFSMVDIWLANNLFKAIPDDMQVLLVGDEDQLPSVGPGQVLADLLASELIPYISLQDVYRQKEGSKIIELAHLIKQDACEQEALKNDKDFSFIHCNTHQVVEAVTTVIERARAKGVDLKHIQVMAPMYRSEAGITMINQQLQALINPASPSKREIKTKDAVFRVGDKVLQLVNQPEDNIYNGDIGKVVAIFEEDENVDNIEQLVVDFEGKEVVYERKDYANITHAYCISIHKSQGSEFPIVILPVVSAYNRMLKKNLLYTAITRSKKSLIICGQYQAFLRGTQTLDSNRRYTTLQKQLHERLTTVDESEQPVIEEEDMTPYDFM
ncbi:ATP-dependent DNA helicase, RecD/TraA family [Lentibacillus persicus]|uniref:ATP-dependent RecD2 DNA helicase n=1 Tax=Lentibacillus persicus TaxID=640948 RepID=A0A1I1TIB1_9BACI|nr:ATP-dependent RecD-like DNA helicase [Lentibacillus persicus]SFD56888.1 ATP-dependent DNA helicase, RecD/TraA family [Lentibacillus persicus]